MPSAMREPYFSLKRSNDLMLEDEEDLTSIGTIFLFCRIRKSISKVVFLVAEFRSR